MTSDSYSLKVYYEVGVADFFDDWVWVASDIDDVVDVLYHCEVAFDDLSVLARDFAVYFLGVYTEAENAMVFVWDICGHVLCVVDVE